ncbi:MAG: hypothetical protein NTW19_14545 [Planctomycetota bacterium]|nr:hypothetical protein [Planctomycetota bacterium]
MIRKIHLDFHTLPSTLNVGAAFDPAAFADTPARAHVNAIATPGKCQYGETYFDTKLGHPHPHLARPDLFPATVAACAARGIRVQAYFTLGLDDVAAAKHPEWRQRYKDGSYAAWGAKHICFASPYAEEVVIPEALEMLERCPGLVGFWFDISLYCNGAFHSESFNRVARERLGSEASSDANDDNQRWHLGRELIRDCCRRIDRAIRKRLPDAENYFNSLVVPGEQANIPLQPIQEVENPFAFGGPELMTAHARWLRWHGSPVIGLVSRFMGPWMDPGTLRSPDQMRFDVGRSLALGCHVSMGDHRHPDGTLDPEVYKRIEPIYRDVRACEPWLEGATPCREAVLLSEVETGSPHIIPVFPAATLQAARLLEEIGLQFDIAATNERPPEAKLIITTGKIPRIKDGSSLLVVGGGTPSSDAGNSAANAAGHVAQAGNAFFRCRPALGLGPFAHALTLPFSPLAKAIAKPGTKRGESVQTLAELLSSASTMPPTVGRGVLGPAIVQRGRVIHCAPRLFDEQRETAAPFLREVLRSLCDRLLVRRLVRHSAGTSVAAHLHRVPHGYALQLVHWAMERWDKKLNPVAEFPPLGQIEVELAITEKVREVALWPAKKPIAFKQKDGLCTFTVPRMHVWQLVAVRTAANER